MQLTINGVVLDYDAFDIDQADAYFSGSEQIKKMCEEAQAAYAADTSMQTARAEYTKITNATKAILDRIFGDGTGDKVFGSRISITICCDALDAIRDCAEKQKAAMEARNAKYSAERVARGDGGAH